MAVTFGDWLRRRRRALDLTQAELADLVGYATITIRRLEAGERRPSKQLIDHLARHLRIPTSELDDFRALGRTLVGLAPGAVAEPYGHVMSWHRRTVPYALGELVGREVEENLVIDEIAAGRRLVTISGPGGVGKTRLAMAVGHRCDSLFDDVCWIPLAGLADATYVLPALTEALGMGPGANLLDQRAVRHLSSRRWLLILDAFEQLAEAVPQVAALLQATPTVSLLVTSRSALRIQGEVEVALSPLSVPDQNAAEPASLRRYGSVEMFCTAARRVTPEFRLDAETSPFVADICREVDGLPLGLELAAGALRVLSVEELDARMSEGWRPENLAERSERHRTLDATVHASFELLSGPAQQVLTRASVFASNWAFEAMEALCPDLVGAGVDLLTVLIELRDHSLITARTTGASARYAMLNTVRRYARRRLAEAGSEREVQRRQVDYYVRLAGQACELLVSAHQLDCIQMVTDDLDNLRAALDHAAALARSGPDAEMAARVIDIAAGLERFWSTTGRSAEGAERLRAMLTIETAGPRAMMNGWGALALLEASLGNFTVAETAVTHMRQLAEDAADPRSTCIALRNQGTVALLRGDLGRSEALLSACSRLAGSAPGDEHTRAWATVLLGTVAFLRSDLKRAAAYYRTAVPALEALGDLNFLALVFRRQAQLSLRSGDLTQVHGLARKSLAHNLALRSPVGIAACLTILAALAAREDRFHEAAALLGRADALLEISGNTLAGTDQQEHEAIRSQLQARLGAKALQEALQQAADVPWETLELRSNIAIGDEDDAYR